MTSQRYCIEPVHHIHLFSGEMNLFYLFTSGNAFTSVQLKYVDNNKKKKILSMAWKFPTLPKTRLRCIRQTCGFKISSEDRDENVLVMEFLCRKR
ncbi:hypothetical protein NPIL_628171 [Nephila pilipes]|uniref:Uncharacterized protein n=1 Tax=Nephila pilipes TaxID=299642 RepID=A0A8X6NDF0_NEPPI|nr:hypothetical protein NPIL_628171 [Nephila pilipes]